MILRAVDFVQLCDTGRERRTNVYHGFAQARLGAVERAVREPGGRGVQAGRLHRVVGRRRAATEVLQSAARYPQQEQVQHDQEA